MYPDDLHYTSEHEWVRSEGETVRVGVTDFAQEALGDIVFVTLPEVGAQVTAGQPCGEIESTKSVSDLYAPVSGKVTAVNASLKDAPEQVNNEPYGAGWMIELEPTEKSELSELMSPDAYAQHVAAQ